MAGQALRQELIDAGARLLAVADEAAIRPAGVAWFRDHGIEMWRYYLITPLVDVLGVGPRAVIVKLMEEFRKAEPPEDFSMDNVYVTSPLGPAFALMGKAHRIVGHGLVDEVADTHSLVDVFLYRFDPDAARADPDRLAREFRARHPRAAGRRRTPARGGGVPAHP